MATIILTPDYFRIGTTNHAAEAYQKNGTQKLGGYNRSAYCWESAVKPDLSAIPSGSTIDSVTISLNVISSNHSNTIQVRAQDGGNWTDNGSSSPRRNNPSFFNRAEEFLPVLSNTGGGVGVKVLPSSSALVQTVQDWLDGTGTYTDNGWLITYYTEYFGWFLQFDALEVTIEYSGGTPPARRRIMIIS